MNIIHPQSTELSVHDELITKISEYVEADGVEILTKKGLQKIGLFGKCRRNKITILELQKQFKYKEIMREKHESNIKQSLKKLVDEAGEIVLTQKWLKENEKLLIDNENNSFTYGSILHIQRTNKQFLFENLAKEFQILDEWNLMLSKQYATATPDLNLINKKKTQLRNLYDTEGIGIKAFNSGYLLKNHQNIISTFHTKRIKLCDIAEEWGILEEYNKYIYQLICESRNVNMRTNEWFDNKAKEMITKWGYFPTQEFLKANNEGSFITYMYSIGLNWQQLHEQYNIPLNSKLLARNNFYMNSHAEVCGINFVWCRGIEVKKGEYYKNDYTKNTGRKGIYDLHFKGTIGIYKDKWISVEIWGGKFRKYQEAYNKKREEKEESHKNDIYFLGIEYQDCYNESKLIKILEPYIGVIEPYIFENEKDKTISCTKWNLIADIEKGATYIMENNNNIIPPVTWMLCNGCYKNRHREDWEITKHFNILRYSYAIDRFGGIVKVRQLMDVKYVRSKYDDFRSIEKITHFIKEIYNTYKKFPNAISNEVKTEKRAIKAGKIINARSEEDELLYKKCVCLMSLITDNINVRIMNKTIYEYICNQITK
jgi:hypothetical protein